MEGLMSKFFPSRQKVPTKRGKKTQGEDPAAGAASKLQEFHHLARDVLKRAVTYDESGRKPLALQHYRKARQLVQEALGIDVHPNAAAAVGGIEKELLSWNASCADRIGQLEQEVLSTTTTTTTSSSSSSSSKMNNNMNNRRQPFLARKGAYKPATKGVVSQMDCRPARAAGGAATTSKGKAAKQNDNLKAMIENEILDSSPGVSWNDIAGLQKAKQQLQEMVILPATRPDLFKGLRAPTRGLLLYGPPGNGKTMLAKAVATESSCTFLAISASTLTSKWVGEGEKLVRKLFEVAHERAPSIIFIDEIDSVLSARSSNENEASRRLKTEFLIQFDGVNKGGGQVFVVGASNRPEELDDAVRRRLAKRIHIPLPDPVGRENILADLLKDQKIRITRQEFKDIVARTKGYSASDIKELCHEAAMMAIRELPLAKLATVQEKAVRAITSTDFHKALQTIKSSVSIEQLDHYEKWTKDFGTST